MCYPATLQTTTTAFTAKTKAVMPRITRCLSDSGREKCHSVRMGDLWKLCLVKTKHTQTACLWLCHMWSLPYSEGVSCRRLRSRVNRHIRISNARLNIKRHPYWKSAGKWAEQLFMLSIVVSPHQPTTTSSWRTSLIWPRLIKFAACGDQLRQQFMFRLVFNSLPLAVDLIIGIVRHL